MPNSIRKSAGFTLVELIVGMTVATLVLGVLGAVFVPTLATYRNTQGVSSIQENARYAITTLANAVDQAGFVGCDSSQPGNLVNVTDLPAATAWVANMNAPLRLWAPDQNAVSVISTVTRTMDGGVPVGDVITTLSADFSSFTVDNHDLANQQISFRGDLVSRLDDKIILLNDCTITSMFEVASGAYNSGTNVTTFSYASADTNNCDATSPTQVLLGKRGTNTTAADCDSPALFDTHFFKEGASAARLIATSYYIAPSSVDPTSNALYSISIDSNGAYGTLLNGGLVELLVGVDNLRARYGVLTSSGAMAYVTAKTFTGLGTGANDDVDGDGTVETFANVVSVEISMILSSSTDRGERGDSERQRFEFLDMNGLVVDCEQDTTTTEERTACPDLMYVNNTQSRRLRRVVSKVFTLRNKTL